MTARPEPVAPPPMPSVRARLAAWSEARAWSLSLLALGLMALALLSTPGCASPETATRLQRAQERVAAVQADPAATDADWREAVLELAAAQEAYVRSAADNAEGLLAPGALEGGAVGLGAAALTWLLRQRTRRRLEDELAATHELAAKAADLADHANEAALRAMSKGG